jgi:translation elongation factor EF-G
MSSVIDSNDNPEDPIRPAEEWHVRITVPEEYSGYMIGEVNSRDGYLKELQAEGGEFTIQAALPASEYQAMAVLIAGLKGKTPGRIRREE